MTKQWGFLSLDLRSRVCPSVRMYIRTCGTLFLGNRSLIFSETLHILWACKHEKNVPSAFFYNFHRLAKNWPKWAIWLDVWKSPFKGWKSLKNPKVGVFETNFKLVPFMFLNKPLKRGLSYLDL